MQGIILSVIAGVFISLQTVFNSRVSERFGLWATTTLVFVVGLVVAIPVFLLVGEGSLFHLEKVNLLYMTGGLFGVGIVYSIMRGIRALGPAYAVSIVLVAQLLLALIIDTFGLFGSEVIPFSISKLVGLCVMVVGIVVFKMK
ncbi:MULTISPECIES: DMT family transporter [Pontibacillus]|uniref:DMT family transporter n=1 Tax=Pontibacillus chungwhensis TaxID=265426 RepID=A0ABY8UTH1_9BACI|nr:MULTISPECIES: DMT family transporter [Pontibacillus]MCD5323419.1 DMT family transporter [Pontibacillus sp. HN14]WIF96799.1 DMT family transporter [Pontibacillus chungwhensis]